MKIDDIKYIWIFVDTDDYVDTEFFYPEIEENKIPYEYVWLYNKEDEWYIEY